MKYSKYNSLLTCLLLLWALIIHVTDVQASAVTSDAKLAEARSLGTTVLQTDFSNGSLTDWVLEGDGQMAIVADYLVVKALDKNATLWHKQRLYGDVLIEFVAHIDPPVAAANLNAFVHATDPSGKPIYAGARSGAYAEYHTVPLYIFTFTGDQEGRDDATGWARFRKDPGFSILTENHAYKAVTGETYQVSILVEGGRFRYYLNNELVHDFTDPQPYRSGWFAIRTWNTNLTIHSLTVKQLREFDMAELDNISAAPPSEIHTNLIANPDFASGVDNTGIPTDWTLFGANMISVVDEKATVGTHCVKLVDNDSARGGGIRSIQVPVEPGTPYRAEVDVFPASGRGVIYMDFMAGGKRVNAIQKATPTGTAQWETVVIEGTAPNGAETVSLILYSYKPDVATLYYDNVRLYDMSKTAAVINNRQPKTNEIGYRPQEGLPTETNPPSFIWLPEPWAKQYMLEYSTAPDFTPTATIKVEPLDYAMYLPTNPLASGVWYWRYWAITAEGEIVGPSATREFNVTEAAWPVSLPAVTQVRERISTGHPRLFITPEQVPELSERWSALELRLLFSRGYYAGITGVTLPQLQPTAAEVTSSLALLQELGVLWAATGEARYGDAGRTLLLHMTKVEPMPANVPVGTGKDAIYMALVTGMSRGYDWLYHALNADERATVLAYLHDLGTYTFSRLRTPPFEASPYKSHEGRVMGFLAELSIATMGELPEAAEWFDFVLQILYNVYPAWGGADGGWSEGANYWASYMNFIFDSIDAIEMATGLNLYQKPFFQNTGYYKLYTHPPLTGIPFGDGLGKAVDTSSRVAMSRLASIIDNGHFAWYVQQTGGAEKRGGIVGTLVDKPLPKAEAPTNLPLARLFADVGLVTMHTDLANPANNVTFQLRSSPYGSISHSHADQNSFVLYAYGDGLAISSGYYPWSQSPHHSQWTNQTLSKNVLLINGEGQRTFSMDAQGQIEQFIHTETYDYTVGEAAAAYNTPVDSYKRHVVFLRPDLFVIIDDVRTPEASTVEWVQHSAFPITWDGAMDKIHTSGPNGQLDTHVIAFDAEWFATISDQFVPPPELDSYDRQWHITLSNDVKTNQHLYIAVLIPNRAGEREKRLRSIHIDQKHVNDLTINLGYLKDGVEISSTIELQLTAAGIAQGPKVSTTKP